jgi:hypothetical protein
VNTLKFSSFPSSRIDGYEEKTINRDKKEYEFGKQKKKEKIKLKIKIKKVINIQLPNHFIHLSFCCCKFQW